MASTTADHNPPASQHADSESGTRAGKGAETDTKAGASGGTSSQHPSYAEVAARAPVESQESSPGDHTSAPSAAHGNGGSPSTDLRSGRPNGTSRVNGANGANRAHEEPPPTSKIRFAPLRVPFYRRQQTFAVLVHCTCMMMSITLFFFACANPLLWPIIVPYVLMVLFSSTYQDGTLSWRSQRFRGMRLWKWFASYFPAELHKTHDLPADRKYIFGYHPHGIISHGAWVSFATEGVGFSEKFPGITNSLLTLDSNFNIPIYREYLLLSGVQSVSRESITNLLSKGGSDGHGKGRAVSIVIGGARESLQAHPGTMRLVLRGRYGFIKMAMATGADLVPVLGFGEVDLYNQLNGEEHPWVHKFQMFVLKVWRFTLPFMTGRGIWNYDRGLLPYRHPLNIVVGKPIKVNAAGVSNGNIDQDEVLRLHELYCNELQRMWDLYKDQYAPDRTEELKFLA